MADDMRDLQEPFGLKTVSESGVAPKERLGSQMRRRELAKNLIRNDEKRAAFDARLRGCKDGNPPYSMTKLKKHAQGWRDSTNYGEFKAAISAALVPYYDLLNGSSQYSRIQLRLEDQTVSAEKSDIASEEWDRVLKETPTLEHNLMLAMFDRLTYGKGFLAWDDKWEVEFRWVNRFNCHVPDRTLAGVDSLEVLVLEEDFPVDKLWRHMNAKRAGERGWKPEECKKAIRRAESKRLDDPYHPDVQQQAAADKDILDGQSSPSVHVAHVFVTEFEGGISHYIVELDGSETDPDGSKPTDDLYAKHNEYDNWNQCFWATFHELGDGSWNGTSGLGKDIIKHCEIKNRLKSAATDLAFIRSGVMLMAREQGSFGKMAMINMGPFNIIPPGYDMVNVAQNVGDMESVLGLDESIYRTMGRNTGIYQQLPEKNQGNPLTATGEMLRQQHSAVLTNSAVSRFYRDLDKLYAEMYRRAIEAPDGMRSDIGKEFIKRCKTRGVEFVDLQAVDFVRAHRTSGNGSLVMRQQNLAQLAGLMSLFPPKGQEEWIRDSVSTLTNFDTASRYMPKLEAGEDITHHHQIAQLESGNLADGRPVIFSPNDNHVIHAQNHLQNATGAIQSLEQGGDPMSVLAALEALGPHASMHIAALEGNPARQNEGKMLRKQWNQIAQVTDQLRKQVEKQQQSQQDQQQKMMEAKLVEMQMDPESQLERAKFERDMALREAKTKVLLEQKAVKDQHGMALADAKAASEIRLSGARTASEIQQSNVRTAVEMENSRKKAEAKPAKEKE